MKTLAALPLIITLLACNAESTSADGPEVDAGPCAPASTTGEVTLDVPARRQVDVLWVVDDSGSMCEKQGRLAEAFRGVAADIVASGVDYRMAVTTTDLRTPTAKGRFRDAPAPRTPGPGLCEALERTADCPLDPEAPPDAPRLAFGPMLSNADAELTAEVLADRFACLAVAGTSGDGFEKGLEAMRLALDCNGPNAALFSACCVASDAGDRAFDPTCPGSADAAPEFLRPGADLFVVFLTDEVDCSDPASNPGASRRAICRSGPDDGPDADALPDGFAHPALCPDGNAAACYAAECGDLAPDACHAARCVVDRADNDDCEWRRDVLTPVGEYVDFLRNLKPGRPRGVTVVSIVGDRSRVELADGEVVDASFVPGPVPEACQWQSTAGPEPTRTFVDSVCCPDGVCTGGPSPSCESAAGVAFNGLRYLQLAEAFEGDAADCATYGACGSICHDTFSREVHRVSDQFTALRYVVCLSSLPVCETAAGDACETQADRETPANYGRHLTVTQSCVGDACTPDAAPFELEGEAYEIRGTDACPSGLEVQLLGALPGGAHVEVTWPTDPAGACAVP